MGEFLDTLILCLQPLCLVSDSAGVVGNPPVQLLSAEDLASAFVQHLEDRAVGSTLVVNLVITEVHLELRLRFFVVSEFHADPEISVVIPD